MVSKAIEPQISARADRDTSMLMGITRLISDPVRMRVDHVLVGAREGDEREPGTPRQTHRKGSRRRERHEERHAHGSSLLHHLVARAAGDDHVAGGEIGLGARQRADGLVEGVVPADILANHLDALARNDPRRRMDAAGPGVDHLPF